MPRYRYYRQPEPEPTWASDLAGGLGRGFGTGIEAVMQKKLEDKIQRKRSTEELEMKGYRQLGEAEPLPEEREEAVNLGTPDKSEWWVKPLSAYEKSERAWKEEQRVQKRGEWKIKAEEKEEKDPLSAAKKKQDLINSIIKSYGGGEIDDRGRQLLQSLETERDELIGFEYKPSPSITQEETPVEKPGMVDKLGEWLRNRAEQKALERNVPIQPTGQPIAPQGAPQPIPGGVPPSVPPEGEGKVLTPEMAKEYLDRANGDKDLARQMAAQEGWQF